MHWQHQRTMTHLEYQGAIHRLGMNKAQAGRFLGVCERTAYRYWDGHTKIPEAQALLLRALIHYDDYPRVPLYEGVRAKRAKERAGAETARG